MALRTTSLSTSLEPGQYHDAETDLFQNWNRFYDPSIGRYLEPEPLLTQPNWTPVYSYARSNPIALADPNGLWVTVGSDRNDWWNHLIDAVWELNAYPEAPEFFSALFRNRSFN